MNSSVSPAALLSLPRKCGALPRLIELAMAPAVKQAARNSATAILRQVVQHDRESSAQVRSVAFVSREANRLSAVGGVFSLAQVIFDLVELLDKMTSAPRKGADAGESKKPAAAEHEVIDPWAKPKPSKTPTKTSVTAAAITKAPESSSPDRTVDPKCPLAGRNAEVVFDTRAWSFMGTRDTQPRKLVFTQLLRVPVGFGWQYHLWSDPDRSATKLMLFAVR